MRDVHQTAQTQQIESAVPLKRRVKERTAFEFDFSDYRDGDGVGRHKEKLRKKRNRKIGFYLRGDVYPLHGAADRTRTGTVFTPRDFLATLCCHSRHIRRCSPDFVFAITIRF